MIFTLFMHHIAFVLYIFVLTYSLPLVLFCFFFFSLYLLCVFGHSPSTMPRKIRVNRVPSTPSVSPSRSQLFKNDCCRETFEKLNSKRKIWAERSVILDEVDSAIRANLDRKSVV